MSVSGQSLPIYALRDQLVARLRDSRRLIIRAPTGSGKSTQVPQMLLESGLIQGEIIVLEPRRLAARMLAARVARERGVSLGDEVGYQIRFDSRVSKKSRIIYVTEGLVLRRMLGNPSLSGVGAIVFDEFHERHLDGDLCLALASQLQKSRRPDLTLAVMSATLETDALARFLEPATVLESEGRTYPVEHRYEAAPASREWPVWESAAEAVEKHFARTSGHTLVFMPGSYEITKTMAAIRDRIGAKEAAVLPLHGELSADQQDQAVEPSEARKIIVATNVAETSITVDGVSLVVDSGLARIARHDPHRGINTLLVEKISRASSDQRAGRAGRTGPGLCVRLWAEHEHRLRPAFDQPEIHRVDLSETALFLKAHGFPRADEFPWFEKPEAKHLAHAEELLHDLGAAGQDGAITEDGRSMLEFPVHPRFARMFLEARRLGCFPAAAMVAALCQVRSLFIRATDKRVREKREELFGDSAPSDFFPLMRAYSFASRNQFDPRRCDAYGIHAGSARQAAMIHSQLLSLAGDVPATPAPNDDAVRRCILAGFADHVARRVDSGTVRYDLVHRRRGVLDRDSLAGESSLLVAAEIREIESAHGELRVQLSLNTAIEEAWLHDLFPSDFRDEASVFYDAVQRKVFAVRRKLFRDLVLAEEKAGEPGADAAAGLLAAEVAAGRLVLKNWDDDCEQWITRVNLLSGWWPELGLHPIGSEEKITLLENICHGSFSYKEIKEAEVKPKLREWLSREQLAALDELAPTHLVLKSGRRAKITYTPDGAAAVASRLQDFIGQRGELRIAGGRVALRLELLAPNMRPVQVTQNLDTFWTATYPKIRQELMRKYPKHAWPENL